MLKAPSDVADHRLPVGLADVARVDRLKAQPRYSRDQGDQLPADQEAREEGAGEEPADLAAGLGLEDQAGAEADDAYVGLAGLKASSIVSTAAL